MKKANISQLKDQLSSYVAYVRRGGSVRVFDRDTPVAELVPICRGPGDATGTALPMEQLARDGVVDLATASLPDDLLTRTLPKAAHGVVDALLDERRDSR